jgi:hypothetical protein
MCKATQFAPPPLTNSANLLDCTFALTLSTVSEMAMSFEKLVRWVHLIPDLQSLDKQTQLAFNFLKFCMELDPKKHCSATEALGHPFLAEAEEDQFLDDDVVLANTEEHKSKSMDALEVQTLGRTSQGIIRLKDRFFLHCFSRVHTTHFPHPMGHRTKSTRPISSMQSIPRHHRQS